MFLTFGLFIIFGGVLDIALSGFSGIHIIFITAGLLLSLWDFSSMLIEKFLSGNRYSKLIIILSKILILLLVAGFYFLSPKLVLSKASPLETQVSKALELAAKKDFSKANEALKTLSEKNPTDMNIKYQMGKLLMEQKRYEEAFKVLNEVLAVNPVHHDAVVRRINFFIERKDWNTVKNEAKRMISLYPHRPESYMILADTYWNEGDLIRSVHYYKLAVREAPDSSEYHFKLGSAYSKSHTYGDALYELRLARELTSSDDEKQKISSAIKSLSKEIDNGELKKQEPDPAIKGGASDDKK